MPHPVALELRLWDELTATLRQVGWQSQNLTNAPHAVHQEITLQQLLEELGDGQVHVAVMLSAPFAVQGETLQADGCVDAEYRFDLAVLCKTTRDLSLDRKAIQMARDLRAALQHRPMVAAGGALLLLDETFGDIDWELHYEDGILNVGIAFRVQASATEAD